MLPGGEGLKGHLISLPFKKNCCGCLKVCIQVNLSLPLISHEAAQVLFEKPCSTCVLFSLQREEEMAYVLYNDEPPKENFSGSKGHTKGIKCIASNVLKEIG